MTHYISCHFGNNPHRALLTEEFSKRYPWVTILRNDKTYFCDYELINEYIRKNRKNIDTLVLIDGDLILEEDFRQKINIPQDYPTVLQGYKISREVHKNKIFGQVVNSYMYDNKQGHSGYIWIYNRKALSIIQQFPEFFIYGGFDWILALCLTDQDPTMWLGSKSYKEEITEFKKKVKHFRVGYVDTKVLHNFHGSKLERKTPWELY